MRNSLLFLALIGLFSVPALAEDRAMGTARAKAQAEAQECTLQETANVGFNFNGTESDPLQIKAKIDKKIDDARALAKEAGVETLEVQSYNYSVYANNASGGCCEGDCAGSGSGYQMNGSVNFTVKPAAKAGGFAALLSQKGFNANFNVNAYNQCH